MAMDDTQKGSLPGLSLADSRTTRVTPEEALALHAEGRPGKLEIRLTKPLITARDLSLAYSPGVAEPCLHIARDPTLAYDYTAKGNFVAVISNGTAVLGLGNLGALASKPVMEGKVALFKRFADVDGIDLCVDTEDVDAFVNAVRYLGPSFGGINLEDIKAPECFVIEQRLRELMDIPVFHDDQHGTAIVAAAGLINACHLTGRDLRDTHLVINGAGAAAIACAELLKAMGMRPANIIMCDTKGVVYQGRTEGMNQWKSAHAVDTTARTLTQALDGADVLLRPVGEGRGDAGHAARHGRQADHLRHGQPRPRDHARRRPRRRGRTASSPPGASDYPNQVNNVLGFPFIFRGALDVRASTINDAMKIAAAQALAMLAREDVPEEVNTAGAGPGTALRFGPEYIIPNAFDPRLISRVPPAVAKAAMDSGVARRPITDLPRYARDLAGRLDATADALELITERVRANPAARGLRRGRGGEGDPRRHRLPQRRLRHARCWSGARTGSTPRVAAIGVPLPDGIEIHNARLSDRNQRYAEYLYARRQREGFLLRDCQRLVNQDRNVFAACMVAMGDADAMVTGVTRSYAVALEGMTTAIDPAPRPSANGTTLPPVLFGLTLMLARVSGTVFVADTAIHERPDAATAGRDRGAVGRRGAPAGA